MSFLTIPGQEGLFTAVRSCKSSPAAEPRQPAENGDGHEDGEEEEEEEDDDDTNVRLIPRCSPVPRKRGASIYDETAEYLRIQQALAAGKRVSFADTTGGDLVDVKEFDAYESEDEEESARWEEEEAKYRKPEREPTYTVRAEFQAPAGDALLRAVRAARLEVESVSAVEGEPLAFAGIVRVLNVSFHKAVYVRSTMDSWASHFDHPAEYVQGSHDGDTDRFSFKLSFAPPYITHGSRIEFVVRYETSEGDYWANNSSMNYVVTLLLSYKDDWDRAAVNTRQMKSILRPPKDYSMNDDFQSDEEEEKEEAQEAKSRLVRPVAICPAIVQPVIDVELAVRPSGPPVPPHQDLPSVDGPPCAQCVTPSEESPHVPPGAAPSQSSSYSALCAAGEWAEPEERGLGPPGPQTPEQRAEDGPSAPPSAAAPPPQSEPTLDSAAEETPPSETDLHRATEEADRAARPLPQPPAAGSDCASAAAETLGCELAAGPDQSAAGSAAAHHAAAAAAAAVVLSGAYDRHPAEGPGDAEASQNSVPEPVPPQLPSEALPEDLAPRSSPDPDLGADLMLCAACLSGAVSLSVVLQEPSALFFIGLLLVMHRL